MAECGTDAQIHVCRYEGGAQAWLERRTGRSLGAELSILQQTHTGLHTCTSFISRFSRPYHPSSPFYLISRRAKNVASKSALLKR